MLRMYDYPKKWENYLHLVEFAYNNHYQASTNLSPFEILYVENVKLLLPGVIQWTD